MVQPDFLVRMCLVLLPVVVQENNAIVKSSERKLFEYLMTSYDPGSRPVINANHTVKVNFSISLNKIHDLVEKNQTLITHVWIFEEWIDELLQWKPEKFGGQETAVIPSNRIWLPDIYIFNNAGKGDVGFVTSPGSKLLVHHSGLVTWSIPVIIKSSCTVDVRYFPFDNQHCFLRFGSWIYEESQVDLQLKNNAVDLSEPFSENTELELHSTNITRQVMSYPSQPGHYPQVTMYLSIRRKPVFYTYTVIAPTLILCILCLFSFLLPCDNGDKVGIGLTVFLSLYVLQLAIAENIPESNSLPLISLFLILVMTLNAISLVFATLVINAKKKGDRKNCPMVPDGVLNICKMIFAKMTCTPFINFYDFYGYCQPERVSQEIQEPITMQNSNDIFSGNSPRLGNTSLGVATFRPRVKQHKKNYLSVNQNECFGSNHIEMKEFQLKNDTMNSEIPPPPPRDPRYEWFFVAEVLDKTLFLVFLVGMVLTIVISLMVVPYMHRND